MNCLPMNPVTKRITSTFFSALVTSPVSADALVNQNSSFQGFTGLFNIPNAETTRYGEAEFQYSNQVERASAYRSGDNYTVSAGLLPILEINGRIASDGPLRDLSGNIKLQIPYHFNNWFKLSAGLQDVGGVEFAKNFTSYYLVASKTLSQVRLSAGYGRSDSELGRLNGPFAGIEWTPQPWVDLLAEYDASEINAGFRLHTPQSWFNNWFQLDASVLAYSGDNGAGSSNPSDEVFYSVGIHFPMATGYVHSQASIVRTTRQSVATNNDIARQIPLMPQLTPQAISIKSNNPLDKSSEYQYQASKKQHRQHETTKTINPVRSKHPNWAPRTLARSAHKIHDHLHNLGFESLQIGYSRSSAQLTVSYENNVFNQNELDGLGVALGVATHFAEQGTNSTRIIVKNGGISVMEVSTSVKAYREFLAHDCTQKAVECLPYSPVSNLLSVRYAAENEHNTSAENAIHWIINQQGEDLFVPRIIAFPVMVYGLATEVGVFDYSLALRTNINSTLWQGGRVSAEWDIPLDNTSDFEGRGAYANQAIEGGLKNAFLHQTFKLWPNREIQTYNQTSIGRYRENYNGAFNDTLWLSPSGTHRLKAQLGLFAHQDSNNNDDRGLYLGSYRYYWDRWDMALELTGGQFWNQDQGFALETKQYFGDTSIGLFFKHTDFSVAGLSISVPLTPRKDMSPRGFQVRGAERWSWSFQTVVDEDTNFTDFGAARVPSLTHQLDRVYFNNDRLSEAYIQRHIYRLKDANNRWGIPAQ